MIDDFMETMSMLRKTMSCRFLPRPAGQAERQIFLCSLLQSFISLLSYCYNFTALKMQGQTKLFWRSRASYAFLERKPSLNERKRERGGRERQRERGIERKKGIDIEKFHHGACKESSDRPARRNASLKEEEEKMQSSCCVWRASFGLCSADIFWNRWSNNEQQRERRFFPN